MTRSERYGESPPLRDIVLLGEEIITTFSKKLNCERPFAFDVRVKFLGTSYIFDREKLLVICEGRKIRIQIDQIVGTNVEDIMDKNLKRK